MNKQSFNIPTEEFQKIEDLIKNDKLTADGSYSNVQVIILYKLMEIQKQINKIEERWMTPLIH